MMLMMDAGELTMLMMTMMMAMGHELYYCSQCGHNHSYAVTDIMSIMPFFYSDECCR